MKIKWKKTIELEIIENYDEAKDEIINSYDEIIKKGTIDEVDIFGEEGDFVNMQFSNGSVSLYILKSLFIVLEK